MKQIWIWILGGVIFILLGGLTNYLLLNNLLSQQTMGFRNVQETIDYSYVTSDFDPASDNFYDIGVSSTQWRYLNLQGGVFTADGSTTSTLFNNSITLGQAENFPQGKFYIDSSGNVSASGTIYAKTQFYVVDSGEYISAQSYLTESALVIGKRPDTMITSDYGLGTFNVDSSGNINASGTLRMAGGNSSRVNATSTDGVAATLIASDLTSYEFLSVTPNTSDLTYTLPAVSTLTSIIVNTGDHKRWGISNATTTAGIDIILAAGTGVVLDTSSSTLNINPGHTRIMECWKLENTDLNCYLY